MDKRMKLSANVHRIVDFLAPIMDNTKEVVFTTSKESALYNILKQVHTMLKEVNK